MTAKGAKLKEAIAQRQGHFKAQTITVDDNWKIVRIDEYNWQIHSDIPAYKVYRSYYYGTLISALRALPDLMLQEEAKKDLQALLRTQRAIEDRMDQVLRMKLQ